MSGPPLLEQVDGQTFEQTEIELFSVAGRDGFLRKVNQAFADLLALDPAALDDRSILTLVHPDDVPAVVAGIAALDRGAGEVLLENRFLRSTGEYVHLQWVARPVAGTDLWWAAGRDTTAFHQLVADQQALRTRFDLAVGSSVAAMWEYDVVGQRLTWEPQAAGMLSHGLDVGDEQDGLPATLDALAALLCPPDVPGLYAAFDQLTHTRPARADTDTSAGAGDTATVEIRLDVDGQLRHLSLRGRVIDRDRRQRPLRVVGLILDITTEKAMQEQMLRLVMSDALTGAPNRRAFDQTLRAEWRRGTRAGEPLSLLMIDIDDFKQFNDELGHLVGDDALCSVARALMETVQRGGDVIARYGGEEFAAVLPATDAAGAMALAEQVLATVRAVVVRQAPDHRLTASVGVATWVTGCDYAKPTALLAAADSALYVAKAGGKDRAATAR